MARTKATVKALAKGKGKGKGKKVAPVGNKTKVAPMMVQGANLFLRKVLAGAREHVLERHRQIFDRRKEYYAAESAWMVETDEDRPSYDPLKEIWDRVIPRVDKGDFEVHEDQCKNMDEFFCQLLRVHEGLIDAMNVVDSIFATFGARHKMYLDKCKGSQV